VMLAAVFVMPALRKWRERSALGSVIRDAAAQPETASSRPHSREMNQIVNQEK
jgi:hypothetical protein